MNITATIIEHQQGSEAWLQYRARSLNASELAAVMGMSSYATRADILKQKATGIVPEVDAATQRRFDDGHRFEGIARRWAEEMIGEDLYPVVLAAEVDGLSLSASLDGQTMTGEITFEHKTGRADLLASLEAGAIPDEYHPQLEQGLLLSGASRCLFMASSGERESMRFAWYESRPDLRAKIIPTWKQFQADLAAYVPPAASAVEKIVAEPVESLPAPVVQVFGQLTLQDNFKVFEERLHHFLEHRLIREPKSDEDFVNLDAQIKAMKQAREALGAAEAQMLAQVQPVDRAKKTKDMLDKLLQQNVSMAERLLKDEKERRKGDIVAAGAKGLADHIAALNQRLGKPYMPQVPADFGGVIRGLKSLASMEDKVATELARAKIAASEIAGRIQENLNTLRELASEHAFLFADTATIVLKAPDDCRALVQLRIAEHRAAEERRAAELAERERARIRAEEAERLEREAAQRALMEAAAAEAAQRAAAPAPTQPPTPAPTAAPAVSSQAASVVPMQRPTPAPASPPTLKLGQIGERLGFALQADFLKRLGFEPAGRERAALLFHEQQFPLICEALVAHVRTVQAQREAA